MCSPHHISRVEYRGSTALAIHRARCEGMMRIKETWEHTDLSELPAYGVVFQHSIRHTIAFFQKQNQILVFACNATIFVAWEANIFRCTQKNLFRFLLNQPESDYKYHFPIDLVHE